ncbi:MAG: 5-methylcytosine-specific restriction endonuclease system specificity protein McrC [Coriobacteriales bacterium]|nr:5-methylcytosine-specific restriction endonuclease system specificity protein McrC [Coriobacteriales bacterium]
MGRRSAQVHKVIRIQNIYHMLAYAFHVLREQGYRDVATEEFANTAELCAAILACGVSSQLKRGLGREYVDRTDTLSTLRGKIEVSESVKTRSVLRRQMVCSYDEFSADTRMNRILKATMVLLVRSDIDKARKKELKRLLVYFGDVSDIDLAPVEWHMRFDRNNQTYRMLMNVCWLVAKGLLQTQSDGSSRLMDFLDEQRMSRLYEKFILEYYRREHPGLNAGAPYIAWALDDGFDDMLPAMHSDITLSRGGTVLIIDAKYYGRTTQQRFDKRSVHSGNLYQIFTYVKNKEVELARAGVQHEVSGMLLYARTDEDVQPDGKYRMSGNQISVRTLGLDVPFEEIKAQLNDIVATHFAEEAV